MVRGLALSEAGRSQRPLGLRLQRLKGACLCGLAGRNDTTMGNIGGKVTVSGIHAAPDNFSQSHL